MRMQYLQRVLEHYFGKRKKPALMAGSVYDGLSKHDLRALHNSPEARRFRAALARP